MQFGETLKRSASECEGSAGLCMVSAVTEEGNVAMYHISIHPD